MPHGTARSLAAFGLLLAATATAVRGGPIPVGIQEAPGARQGAPYLLDVCVVSGRRLPADGGVVMEHTSHHNDIDVLFHSMGR